MFTGLGVNNRRWCDLIRARHPVWADRLIERIHSEKMFLQSNQLAKHLQTKAYYLVQVLGVSGEGRRGCWVIFVICITFSSTCITLWTDTCSIFFFFIFYFIVSWIEWHCPSFLYTSCHKFTFAMTCWLHCLSSSIWEKNAQSKYILIKKQKQTSASAARWILARWSFVFFCLFQSSY